MKILEPVKELPVPVPLKGYLSKYSPVYRAALALKNGTYLPIEFESRAEGKSLVHSVTQKRRRRGLPLRAFQRGLVVYVVREEA